MGSVGLKPQYGPTLGQLLAPRWRSSARWLRGVVIVGGCGLVALAIAAVLALEPASYSHGSAPAFSFTYRGLYRVPPPAGAYVSLERHASGSLADSFTVWPLQLPGYEGSVSAELAVFAAGYIKGLERGYGHFVLLGEGKTRVNTLPGYTVFFRTQLAGRRMDGRAVLLVPERAAARRGVTIVMLAARRDQIRLSLEVGNSGVLKRPLHSFEFH